ncbi:tRNA glutamyl-Q(34) synthetase GluQRS [Allopusillimonas soli]|uniref:Glutamyl-Q tRNA(Asp) synthetase n=1 Tax=Allopusillimonas soli TaxID=659016 RepID=A0A853FE05_9BURK|nr:tRNA glutamyl-Q(34) synthetase GluQRS [Allopusillimonas soli]NYT37892.1 tRNA glutamyl-Q(34) synthetase GluQRS [Allopusillimonas soli]TEA73795.1 tRNA glutamyl-Q(34) synthetase GluQRS [Allopusillimonas soli]
MAAVALNPVGTRYRGRFAPSPSGPLHNGSLLAAMASYLDARAHGGEWLLRIEDIDEPRSIPGVDRIILQQLRTLGMHWDAEPTWQSERLPLYQAAFDRLRAQGLAYGCACTRQELPSEGRYPGTCSRGLPPGRRARAWRFRVPAGTERFTDRWHGAQQQDVQEETGDFIIRRADGYWAYQLAVVVDDGHQGITDVVRGADLLTSTARQRILQRQLGYPCPRVMHIPLMYDEHGRKLSKQNHAAAMDLARPVDTLNKAWQALGFDALRVADIPAFWMAALPRWADRFHLRRP